MPTLENIQNSQLEAIQNHPDLTELNSTSKVSIYRLIINVVASAIYALYRFFDLFKVEVNEVLDKRRPHTLRWYVEQAKLYRYGHNLQEDGTYDNDGFTTDEIAESQIIAQASCEEVQIAETYYLEVKVAKDDGDGLYEPLSSTEKDAFTHYLNEVKDAGTRIIVVNRVHDDLRLTADVYYNPLVLSDQGIRLDNTNNSPIQDAVRNYIKNLPFNSRLELTKLIDALQQVEGVQLVNIKLAEARYAQTVWQPIDEVYKSDAGHMRIADDDFLLTFKPHNL